MSKRKVIIDTDPGIDDLLAIAIALESEELDVIAISTVFGNVSLEHTSQNALLICDVLEKELKIIKGAEKPLFYDRKGSASVHGKDGLGGLREKYKSKVEEKNILSNGIIELYNTIMTSEEKITIIALGPLTNIATLLLVDEKIKDKIEEIHIMGGGDRIGNSNELAEFNFYSDGYAAKIVLNSRIPIYLSGLDVTKKVYFTEEELNGLAESSLKQRFIKESVKYYASGDPYMHDICAVLTLTHPEFFEFKDVAADVIASDDITDGMQYILREGKAPQTTKFVDTTKRTEIIEYIFDTIKEKFA